MPLNIGIIGFQGDVSEHADILKKVSRKLGKEIRITDVRKKAQLKSINGLIIPGGESTTIYKLLVMYDLYDEVKKLSTEGLPVMGTCAGLILISSQTNDERVKGMGLLDAEIDRNAYGRQIDSFMSDIEIEGIGMYKAVFIRAPVISNPGKCEVLSSYNGKIIDDTIVYRLEDNKFFFVPNASMIDIIFKWVSDHKEGFNMKLINISSEIACIAVQGPRSPEVVKALGLKFQEPFKFSEEIGNYSRNAITGNNSIIVSGTGYTGETGVELLIPSKDASRIWRDIMNILSNLSGLPCGLGARDTLRMEKGMLLSGTDFNLDRNPYECSVSFIVNNDSDYIGKEAIQDKGDYIFRGFKLSGKSIPRAGSEVLLNGESIGVITSGTLSPVLDSAIALGFVKRTHIKSGPVVQISTRDSLFEAAMGRPKLVP